ncbi:MAG: methyltransferase domain-containing protein [Pseudomonadota bacterium]
MIYEHIPHKLHARLEKIEQELIARFSSNSVIENTLLLGDPRQIALLQSCRSQYRHLACGNYPGFQFKNTQAQAQAQVYFSHFTDLPYAKESMDFIILPHVLEFSAEPSTVLEEAAECLSQRGSLLLFSLSPFSRFAPLFRQNNESHFLPLSLSSAQNLLTANGLHIAASQSFFSLLAYAPETKFFQLCEKTVMPYLPFLCNAYWIIARKTNTPVVRVPLKSYLTQSRSIALEGACAARSGNP